MTSTLNFLTIRLQSFIFQAHEFKKIPAPKNGNPYFFMERNLIDFPVVTFEKSVSVVALRPAQVFRRGRVPGVPDRDGSQHAWTLVRPRRSPNLTVQHFRQEGHHRDRAGGRDGDAAAIRGERRRAAVTGHRAVNPAQGTF